MTPNPTLSIAATVRQDADTYYNQLGIAELPDKPNGESMRYLLSIRQAVIFKNSLHKSLAKKFIRYFIQPQVTIDYLKATNGRGQPVRKSVWSDPFWQNSQDPYIATVTKILTKRQTRLSYEVK
jgi:multiple sugar transport system substrate-binding protein